LAPARHAGTNFSASKRGAAQRFSQWTRLLNLLMRVFEAPLAFPAEKPKMSFVNIAWKMCFYAMRKIVGGDFSQVRGLFAAKLIRRATALVCWIPTDWPEHPKTVLY
jgi:hypothetical protein